MKVAYDLKGERVVVFGGAGFVGSQLVRNLLKHGSEVIVYDNFLHGHQDNLEEIKSQVEIVVGDVLDPWRLDWAFREYKPDFAFSSISETYVPTTYNMLQRTIDNNVTGTVNFLMACRRFDVRRTMWLSSTEVYGDAQTERIDESHPLNPYNSYAATKLAGDRLCYTLHKEQKVPVVIVRFYNGFGPRESEPYVIPDAIAQFAKRDWVELGNIEAERDFCYIEDQCDALIAVMESDIPDGDVVNLGSGTSYSIKSIAERIAKIMGKPADIRVDPRRFRRFDVPRFCADISKLQRYTDWKPMTSLDEGLKMTVEWYRKHGRWSWEEWVPQGVVDFQGGDSRMK